MISKAKYKSFEEVWIQIPPKREAKKEIFYSIHEEWIDAVIWAKKLIKQMEDNTE